MTRLATIVGCLLCLSAAPVRATSIVVNGSFELTTPDMPSNGELLAGSTQIVGWTVTGTSSANDVVDWLGPRGGGPEWLAADGEHIVELDGRNSLHGGIFQTFTTTVGQAYVVSFDLSGNPGDSPTNGFPRIKQLRVAVGDVTQDYEFDSTGLTTRTLVWQPIAFEFVAGSDTATLAFVSLTPEENSYGALIDNVSVAAVAVPEPASLLLLGTGIAGVIARRRRQCSRGEASNEPGETGDQHFGSSVSGPAVILDFPAHESFGGPTA